MQLTTTPAPNHLHLIGLILLIISLFSFPFIFYLNNNRLAKQQIMAFNQQLLNDNYVQAKASYNQLNNLYLSSNQKKALFNKIKLALERKIDILSEQLLSRDYKNIYSIPVNSFLPFQKELSSKISSELERVTTLYQNKAINLTTLQNYYQGIQYIGLISPNLTKYKSLAFAEQLKASYQYDEALTILTKASVNYPNDGLLTAAISACEKEKEQLVVYSGPIQHIFFHPLIAYPELAFDDDSLAKGYNDFFITIPEFTEIIDSLYAKGFVLADPSYLFANIIENGKAKIQQKELLLPEGKKPLILSIDDLNYYEYMQKNGNVHKLIIDQQGNIATLSFNLSGQQVIAHDNEIIPILDNFIEQHPDFSYHGAKGVIALTGYQGIFGYRTNLKDSSTYQQERDTVQKVVEKLKATGWSFASHSYGHPDVKKISLDKLKHDTLRWKEEVEPLTGPTNIYIYPYGSSVLPGDPKFQYLLESGFNILASVGPRAYLKVAPDYVMMDRRHIDGIALQKQKSTLMDLFDPNPVIDKVRP